MWQSGYVRLFRLGATPVRAHWSIALGLLWVSGPHWAPGAWLGLLLLILVHELGHALLARHYRLGVHSIEMDGFGGACVHDAPRHARHGYVIAWGGVLAQGVLLLLVWLLRVAGAWPYGAFFGLLYYVLTSTNMFMIAFNLLPFPPLDGARAWKLFRRRARRRRPPPRPRPGPKKRGGADGTDTTRGDIDRLIDRAFDEARRKR